MFLKGVLLLSTLLRTANAAVCKNGFLIEHNIKYECSEGYKKAIGCVTGKNEDGDFIKFDEYFLDTDYKYQCSQVAGKFAYLPKFCVFREVTPAKPTILEAGEEEMIAEGQQAICKGQKKSKAVTKEIKVLDYTCKWGSQHYEHKESFTNNDIKNQYQSGGRFECVKGKIVQIACLSRNTKKYVLVNTLDTASDGSALICQKSSDLVDGATVFHLKNVEGECEQNGKTHQVNDEWESENGRNWFKCNFDAAKNKTFITKGCIGYSRFTRRKSFRNPDQLTKVHFNANEYFKLTMRSLFVCAPDGSFVDIYKMKCTDADGNKRSHNKKYVIGAMTVFKCSEKLLQKADGTYYADPNWYLYGCEHKKNSKGRFYRLATIRKERLANGTRVSYACHQISEDETIWLLLKDGVYHQNVIMGANQNTPTTTIPTTTTTTTTAAPTTTSTTTPTTTTSTVPTTTTLDIFKGITTVKPTATKYPLDKDCVDEDDEMCAELAPFCLVDQTGNPTPNNKDILIKFHPDNIGNQTQPACEACREDVGSVMKGVDRLCRKTCNPACHLQTTTATQ